MAIEPRLTKQMPWVGTPTQRDLVNAAAEANRTSKAEVMRSALDYVFGLRDGELPPGVTLAQAVEAGRERLG